MLDNNPKVALAASVDEGQMLTADEMELIRNFRLMRAVAKAMMLDVAVLYAKTVPAGRSKVKLVRATD